MKNYLKFALIILSCLQHLSAFAGVEKYPEFQSVNINGAAGTFSRSDRTLRLTNAATGNTLFFVFQQFQGNGQIIARLNRPTGAPGKIGLLFRENTNSISTSAGTFLTTSNTIFERVIRSGQPPITISLTNETHQWLRVVREGDAFSGFHSSDGTNWIQFSAETIEMPERIFGGLAIMRGGEASFENIKFTSSRISSASSNSKFILPANIPINLDAKNLGGPISRTEYFQGVRKIGERTSAPYSIIFSNALADSGFVFAKITDDSGAAFFTEPALWEVKLPSSRATFLYADAETKGNWKDKYGGEGFALANQATNFPAYVNWSTTGFRSHTWAHTSNDERALASANSERRIASSWFNPKQLEIDLTLSDGRPHRFAIYFLDWDRNDRMTLVEIIDPVTKRLLDSRKLSKFEDGKYVAWSLVGTVKIRITGVKANASISGVFFDAIK